jgi:hypothetical protein
MSLFKTLLQAVQSWRRRRAFTKSRRRAGIGLEQLDHRQLLSVNFTGNVATDFPANERPGVVVIPDNPSVVHPLIPIDFQNIIKVSGLDINGIRLSYTPSDDTLSIGLEQPLSQQPSHPGPVIAGDTDNNGNSATVDPAVTAIDPQFIDAPDMGGTKTMGAFLSFTPDGLPTVVAGISNQPSNKHYQVAQAAVNPEFPNTIPGFGTPLPGDTGNVYLVNDPNHPNFEFSITHFSQLYQTETGKALTPDTTFKVGAFGNSDEDDGISEAFFPGQTVRFGDAIVPNTCPPVSPPILINPHEHRHVNTAHPDLVRVTVIGSSGFDPTTIVTDTVRLGGATPIYNFTRHMGVNPFPDETFVFLGNQISLPPGFTTAELTGQLANGTSFDSKFPIFNRDRSFYSPAALARADAQQAAAAAHGVANPLIVKLINQANQLGVALLPQASVPNSNIAQVTGALASNSSMPMSQAQPQIVVPINPTVTIPMRSTPVKLQTVTTGHATATQSQPKTTVPIDPQTKVKIPMRTPTVKLQTTAPVKLQTASTPHTKHNALASADLFAQDLAR